VIPTFDVVVEIAATTPNMSRLTAALRMRTWGTNRDHEAIRPGDWSFAHQVVREEQAIVAAADATSKTAVEFEDALDALADESDWCGLDVGVGGLVHALNAAGCATEISCRAHPGWPWAEYPMVVFACDQMRFRELVPLAAATGVGIDDYAEGGVCLYAQSVRPMMALAQAILDRRPIFTPMPETIPWDDALIEPD